MEPVGLEPDDLLGAIQPDKLTPRLSYTKESSEQGFSDGRFTYVSRVFTPFPSGSGRRADIESLCCASTTCDQARRRPVVDTRGSA